MSTLALNKLWEYIQVLALSDQNKDWLANKLIESKSSDEEISKKEERLYAMFGMWSDDSEFDEIEKSIREGRVSGLTRHIVFTESGYTD